MDGELVFPALIKNANTVKCLTFIEKQIKISMLMYSFHKYSVFDFCRRRSTAKRERNSNMRSTKVPIFLVFRLGDCIFWREGSLVHE